MMQDFVFIQGKKYRKGYTTGSCATAAVKAAVLMLRDRLGVDTVEIETPSGISLTLPIVDARFDEKVACCGVLKDGGDDPDVTTGLIIYAKVKLNDSGRIDITGGEGVGKVTLPGLKIAVGEYAINPVPLQMIAAEVGKVKPEGKGVDICIFVPGGEEIGKKTYNPKLGIVGGISILGTTGIVNPMSEEDWKDSLGLEIDMAKAAGRKTLVFAFGNIGEEFVIQSLGIEEKNIIIISNFVGFMIQKAMENHIERILLAGHIGKLIKVAAGIFNIHSRMADARMETLTAYSGLEGADTELLHKIYGCKTTDAAVTILQENGLNKVFTRIVEEVSRRCKDYTFGKIEFGTILFYWDNKILSYDKNGAEMLEVLGGQVI